MYARIGWGISLAGVALAGGVAGQAAPTPGLLELSLRSLGAGRTIVRVAGHDFGTRTGLAWGVRDGVLWLGPEPAGPSVPLAGIDSMWVRHGHAVTGVGVGALIGLIAGIPIGNSQKCRSFDYTCYPAVSGAAVGAVVGAVVGAAIGAGIRSWHLRYP